MARLVQPDEYVLHLEPDIENQSFTGTVKIVLNIIQDTSVVTLNANRLTIHSASYAEGQKWIPVSYQADEADQSISVSLGKVLIAGSGCTLHFGFKGVMEGVHGFYRSIYNAPDGNVHVMAVTQFEPTHARRVFPCFDEPIARARFTIQMTVDEKYVCLSNMPVAEVTKLEGQKVVRFERTPSMPTYLVGVAVGIFESLKPSTCRFPVTAYTPPGLINEAEFALSVAQRSLVYFESIFDIAFALPKLDLLAVADFDCFAMENWGLITFDFAKILCLNDSTVARKKSVALIVAHEIAHSWFGNLVTIKSWNDLWLKEGFATYLMLLAIGDIFPEWNMDASFVADTLQSALRRDALRGSHPVHMNISSAAEAGSAFDEISYLKGASVLRMLRYELGQHAFINGVRIFLNRHQFGNASVQELAAALTEASGRDVAGFLETWTGRTGFPVVTVTEEESDGVLTLKLDKKRFMARGVPDHGEDHKYPFELRLRTSEGIRTIDFSGDHASITIPAGAAYKLNPDHTSFIRVSYPDGRPRSLAESSLLTVADRIGLVADASALAISGHRPTTSLLALLEALANIEDSFYVWTQIVGSLEALRASWFPLREQRDRILAFGRRVVSRKLQELGWDIADQEPGEERLSLAELLFRTAGRFNHADVVRASKTMFAKFLDGDKQAVPWALKRAAFRIAVANGDKDAFEAIWKIYMKPDTEDDREAARQSMGSNEHAPDALLARILGQDLRLQDTVLALQGIQWTAAGPKAFIGWARENWDEWNARLTPRVMPGVLNLLLSCVHSEAEVRKLEQWLETWEGLGPYSGALQQEVDGALARVAWVERERECVDKWLKDKGY